MKKVILSVYFAMAMIAPHFLGACSCDSLYPFLNAINDRTIIFEGTILSHYQLPLEEIQIYSGLLEAKEWRLKNNSMDDENRPPPPPPPFNFTSYTVIKVEKVLRGLYAEDTIIFFNGHGSMCLSSLEDKKSGSRYIFKVHGTNKEHLNISVKEHLVNKGLLNEIVYKPTFINSICEEWYLAIHDDLIVGNITANYRFIFAREFIRQHPGMTDAERIQYSEGLAKIKTERMLYKEFAEKVIDR
ncbi:MAG: hypothetical protein KA340_08870 [Saprospiraceae bacterium]|jgi:hypothetical protein|nr:hypothetical protein [Saprospiraceae bacterium]